MNEAIVTRDAVVIASDSDPGFSWRAVFAGALVASAVIMFLLFLGAGVGLSLFTVPDASARTAANGLTLGGIYFFAAQAFGLAVGGYLAGRLMGPVLESKHEELSHSTTHGLVTWALAVMTTATMIAVGGLALAGPGLNAAAILGASNQAPASASTTPEGRGYWVDTLFRPVAGSPGARPAAGPTDAEAKAEAGRILSVGLVPNGKLSQADHDQVALLVSQQTGMDNASAASRVDDVQARMVQTATAAAEAARRFARSISLWLAASLIFGALVASGAAVTGRSVDDEARRAS